MGPVRFDFSELLLAGLVTGAIFGAGAFAFVAFAPLPWWFYAGAIADGLGVVGAQSFWRRVVS